jgi:hypothetical protein
MNDDEPDDAENGHVDDALTIDELIECLERLRTQAPEKGATRVRMPDRLPVVSAALETSEESGLSPRGACVVICDQYE